MGEGAVGDSGQLSSSFGLQFKATTNCPITFQLLPDYCPILLPHLQRSIPRFDLALAVADGTGADKPGLALDLPAAPAAAARPASSCERALTSALAGGHRGFLLDLSRNGLVAGLHRLLRLHALLLGSRGLISFCLRCLFE